MFLDKTLKVGALKDSPPRLAPHTRHKAAVGVASQATLTSTDQSSRFGQS
jgi:hypothetical protein